MTIVVDCDFHVMEPANLWVDYLEPEYRDRAIRIEQRDGLETLLIGDVPMLEGRLAGLGGAHLDRATLFGGNLKYADGCPAASYEPAARQQLFKDWQIDKGVTFPTIGILPFPVDDPDLNSAYCRAYNRWQAETFASIKENVIPIAIINWHDIDSATRELEESLKKGFKGVFVPPEVIGNSRPGQSAFDPIWARLEEAGLPGCLHVIVRFGGAAVPFAAWHETAPGPTFTFGLGAPGQLIPALSSMVIDGVFDRFPKLKILSVEAGCGFAAYLMDRLDEKYHFFGQYMPSPLLLKPSEYIQRNCYFVAEPEERTIGAMLELVGEDKIVWGSDFPHIDSNLAAPRLIRDTLSSLDPSQQENVLGGNAVRLFNLGN